MVLVAVVHEGNMQDRDGAKLVFKKAKQLDEPLGGLTDTDV